MQNDRLITTRKGDIPPGAVCAGVNVNGKLSVLLKSYELLTIH